MISAAYAADPFESNTLAAEKYIRRQPEGSRVSLNRANMRIDRTVNLHRDVKAGLDPAIEFCCPACGSLAFRYPRVLDDDKPVLCAGCGAFVSTYGELRQRFGEQD